MNNQSKNAEIRLLASGPMVTDPQKEVLGTREGGSSSSPGIRGSVEKSVALFRNYWNDRRAASKIANELCRSNSSLKDDQRRIVEKHSRSFTFLAATAMLGIHFVSSRLLQRKTRWFFYRPNLPNLLAILPAVLYFNWYSGYRKHQLVTDLLREDALDAETERVIITPSLTDTEHDALQRLKERYRNADMNYCDF